MRTFVKHIYDIDIINIYHLLDNKLSDDTSEKGEAKKKDFLERLSYSIKQIIESNKENYNLKEEDYETLPYYVITPNNDFDNYIFWLGLFLLSNPSFKTNLILEYHYDRWTNKMKFLNSVEFYVLDNISNNDFIKDELVLKTITEWILFKRLNNGYTSSNTDTSEDETRNKTKTNNKTKSNENLILIDKSHYETKDVKSPEYGDPLESSTENQLTSLKFSNKIVIEKFCDFIKENSNEEDEININAILNFKDTKNKIKLLMKLNNFLNLVKAFDINNFLIGGNALLKTTATWIHTNFEFDRSYDIKYIYKKYTQQTGKPSKEFTQKHNELLNLIKEELANPKNGSKKE